MPLPLPASQPAPGPIPTTNTSGQKLILVRVPPGTASGATLHVEVPDEPGRILAAQVPPHVSEFQVAYVPRNNNNAIAAYDVRPTPPMGGNGHGTSMVPYMGATGTGTGAGTGNGAPTMRYVGGAALAGAAGVAMYDHYHHPAHHHQVYDDGGYGDGYGNAMVPYDDYGGDYGGGYGEY